MIAVFADSAMVVRDTLTQINTSTVPADTAAALGALIEGAKGFWEILLPGAHEKIIQWLTSLVGVVPISIVMLLWRYGLIQPLIKLLHKYAPVAAKVIAPLWIQYRAPINSIVVVLVGGMLFGSAWMGVLAGFVKTLTQQVWASAKKKTPEGMARAGMAVLLLVAILALASPSMAQPLQGVTAPPPAETHPPSKLGLQKFFADFPIKIGVGVTGDPREPGKYAHGVVGAGISKALSDHVKLEAHWQRLFTDEPNQRVDGFIYWVF